MRSRSDRRFDGFAPASEFDGPFRGIRPTYRRPKEHGAGASIPGRFSLESISAGRSLDAGILTRGLQCTDGSLLQSSRGQPRRERWNPRYSGRWMGAHRCNKLLMHGPKAIEQAELVRAGTAGRSGRSRMRIGAILLGILLTATFALAAPTESRAQSPSTLLIRGATIIDGLSDAPLRDR